MAIGLGLALVGQNEEASGNGNWNDPAGSTVAQSEPTCGTRSSAHELFALPLGPRLPPMPELEPLLLPPNPLLPRRLQ